MAPTAPNVNLPSLSDLLKTFNTGGTVTAPLTPQGLDQQVQAYTNLKYGPAQQDLYRQQRASGQQQGRITDWYRQYENSINQARNQQKGAYDSAFARQQAMAKGSAKADRQLSAQTTQMEQRSAAQRGATASPDVALKEKQAINQRRLGANSFGGLMLSQGANNLANTSNQLKAAASAAVSQHLTESQLKGNIAAAIQQLLQQKGSYATTIRGQLTDNERKFLLSEATLGVNLNKANNQASIDAANAQTNAQNAQTNAQNAATRIAALAQKASTDDAKFIAKYGITKAEAVKLQKQGKLAGYIKNYLKNSGQGKTPKSPYQGPGGSSAFYSQINDATSVIQRLLAAPNRHYTDAQIRAGLETGSLTGTGAVNPITGQSPTGVKYHSDIIQVAFDIVHLGGLTPHDVSILHSHGIKVGNRYPILRSGGRHQRGTGN